MLKRWVMLLMMVMSATISVVVHAQTCDEFDSASDYADHGDELTEAGSLEGAIAAYTCAIELNPESLHYLNSRGIAYNDAGEFDKAIADYEQILEIDPTYSYAWNNRANIYFDRGDTDLALEGYTKSIEYHPDGDDENFSISYQNRASVYYEQGDYAKAETDLLKAIEYNPDDKSSYLSLAWVYTLLNDAGGQHLQFYNWIQLNATDTSDISLTGSIQDEVYEMSQGKLYRMMFTGTAGQIINISARANPDQDADPLLVLLDPNGIPIASDDDSGVNLDAVISHLELPTDGQYTILLNHAGGGATGDVLVSVDIGDIDGVAVANSFATFNLFVGELAEVFTTGGDRLNLRSGPGLDFEIVTKLEAGTLVNMLEGPRKAEGYAWWRVRDDDGNEGWAVERVEEEQTLQLALLIGEDAIVTTGGDKLNVRTGAGTGNELAFQLDDGVRVTLVEAPQTVDGFQWWHIRTEDGQEGWTIDRFDGDRMLIPAKEVE